MSASQLAHVVVGTAGHIDHGKSSLVRALTGIDPDRWEEEKKRGMTIDLGYADFELPDGRRLGLIDVPGHERFIRNMVAGATGVDVVLLVVAADDGVMPQTREHLQILELLGLSRGVVALNKIDLVDEEMRELALMDIKDFVANTVLKDARIIPVSAETGEGLDELRAEIIAKVDEVPEPATGGLFRMPAQRAFTKPGFGTVVTGVPLAGRIGVGDKVELLPMGEVGKVRGIQALGDAHQEAQAGHRAALQITDVGAKEVARGMVVAEPGYFTAAHFVEGTLRYLSSWDKPLKSHMRVRLHIGTAEVIASLVLMEESTMAPGTEQLVQLRCADPVVCAEGDRFVIRRESPMDTLGGGMIIGCSGQKLRAKRPEVLELLQARRDALENPRARVAIVLRERRSEPSTEAELRPLVRLPAADLTAHLAALVEDGTAVALGRTGRFLERGAYDAAVVAVEQALTAFHAAQPLAMHADVAAIRSAAHLPDQTFAAALEALAAAGTVVVEGKHVRLAGHTVSLSQADQTALAEIERLFQEGGFATPTPREAMDQAGVDRTRGERLFKLLQDQGRVVEIAEAVALHADAIETARQKVIATCKADGQLQSSGFRDMIGTTRKYAIPLLEYFDRSGLTVRVDNVRTLREHHHSSPRAGSQT